jgi:N-ethylmaleimide reductase
MPSPYARRPADALFQKVQVGALELSNRIVMAPLTRNRAGSGLVPSEFAAAYYG